MITANVSLAGDKALLAKLNALPGKVQRGAIRRAMRKASRLMLSAAKQAAPVDTGALRRSLSIRAGRAGRGNVQLRVMADWKGLRQRIDRRIAAKKKVNAGVASRTRRARFYGGYQEYGTRHHKAQSYLRPAFERTKDEAVQVFVTELRSELATA